MFYYYLQKKHIHTSSKQILHWFWWSKKKKLVKKWTVYYGFVTINQIIIQGYLDKDIETDNIQTFWCFLTRVHELAMIAEP
jgi:hypothetical protein